MANYIPYVQFSAPSIPKQGGGFFSDLGSALGTVGGAVVGSAIPGVGTAAGALAGGTLGRATASMISGEGPSAGPNLAGPIAQAMGAEDTTNPDETKPGTTTEQTAVTGAASIQNEEQINAAIAAALGLTPGMYFASGQGYQF